MNDLTLFIQPNRELTDCEHNELLNMLKSIDDKYGFKNTPIFVLSNEIHLMNKKEVIDLFEKLVKDLKGE